MKRNSLLILVLFGGIISAMTGAEAPSPKTADVKERNKAVAQRVFDEILTGGRFDVAAELYDPHFVNHGRTRDADLAEDQAAARGWRSAAPDMVMKTDLLLAEGDLVAVLWRASGTNTGEGNGFPATGKHINGKGITVWRFANGKIVEEWSEFSMLQLLREAGLVPGGTGVVRDPLPFPQSLGDRIKTVDAKTMERNRRMARSVFEEILGQGKVELFASMYSSEFANHGQYGISKVTDEIEGTNGFRTLAPDLKTTVTQTIAEGEFLMITYLADGTNTGAAMGLPATGKPFRMRGMSIFRFHDGKIQDEWSVLDQYQVLKDLGLL